MSGVRVELKITGDHCPVVRASDDGEFSVNSVNVAKGRHDERVLEEVVIEQHDAELEVPFDQVFVDGNFSVYEFERPNDCACEHVETHLERPISDITVGENALTLTVHLENLGRLQSVIETLREKYDCVAVQKIVKSDAQLESDRIVIDGGQLTARQFEVFQTAYEMGYLTHPRESNATEVAEELGIAISTFTEHLVAAQAKFAQELFDK